MSITIKTAIDICRRIIGYKPTVTQQEIDGAINKLMLMEPTIDQARLRDELIRQYNIQVENFLILEGSEARQPWLDTFRESHTVFPFWNRYTRFLIEQKGLSMRIVGQLDTMTNKILDNLYNPLDACKRNIHIFKKGMVVGQVQSGKTSNYTGLLCKAVDAGFNLIIVLAGIHNSLRSQTQSRIDEGFLGFSTLELGTQQNSKIGVGLDPDNPSLVAHALTTARDNGDFNLRQAQSSGISFSTNDPIILVIKKNKSPLNNLITYLNNRLDETQTKSVLVIDDEADNAGIGTQKQGEDPSVINGLIRNLLGLFHRKAYVGYTATPYANIFIDSTVDDDLFPKDFIISLPAPSNYIGPDKVFATSSSGEDDDTHCLPIVNAINDFTDFVPTRHRRGDNLPNYDLIPNSLKHAVASFILTCGIRYFRGQTTAHNSMLIHVSRYTNWQNRIVDLVTQLFEYFRNSINVGDSVVLDYFRDIFEGNNVFDSYKKVTQTILNVPKLKELDTDFRMPSWEELRSILIITTPKITIKEINGSAGETLDYHRHRESGLSVIAIGGDRLSRGLTLEGLSISYFLRASKLYDTLMQMGRWFGYRPSYVDLCRIYLSPELIEWFQHITLADEELRQEFKYMVEAGFTPDRFRLKVRTHPGNLQITSAGKMRNGIRMYVSWAGRLAETYQLSMDQRDIVGNFNAASNLVDNLSKYNKVESVRKNTYYLWKHVPYSVVCEFLNSYTTPDSLRKVDLSLIVNYIESAQQRNELTEWSVVIMNKTSNVETTYNLGQRITGGCFDRTPTEDTDPQSYYIRKNHILGNPSDEFLDLDDELLQKALERTRKLKERQGEKEWEKPYPSPQVVRSEFRSPTCGLLIIYPLNPVKANTPKNNAHFTPNDTPFIGFAISFPNSSDSTGVEYVVSNIEEFKQTEDIFEQDSYAN